MQPYFNPSKFSPTGWLKLDTKWRFSTFCNICYFTLPWPLTETKKAKQGKKAFKKLKIKKSFHIINNYDFPASFK